MTSREARPCELLPPPVETILLFAADGLSMRDKLFAPSGRPRTPERGQWVPLFRLLVESKEGRRTLLQLAQDGIRGWGLSRHMLDCSAAAFGHVSFKARAILALEELADTARERFTLPPPPQSPPPTPHTPLSARPESPPPPRPRPERPAPRRGPGNRPSPR